MYVLVIFTTNGLWVLRYVLCYLKKLLTFHAFFFFPLCVYCSVIEKKSVWSWGLRSYL